MTIKTAYRWALEGLHESGSFVCVFGSGPDKFGRQQLASQNGLDAIGYPVWQFVGPLVNRLVGDANCVGGCGHGAPEKFNGLLLEHALLNHSSEKCATMVQRNFAMFATMVADHPEPDGAYALRVRQVVGLGETSDKLADNKASNEIAAKLQITYQAAAKVIQQRKKFGAPKSAEFAKAYAVDHYWLATGKGKREIAQWPFPDIDRARFDQLEPNQKIEIQGLVRERIEKFEASQTKPISPAAGAGMLEPTFDAEQQQTGGAHRVR